MYFIYHNIKLFFFYNHTTRPHREEFSNFDEYEAKSEFLSYILKSPELNPKASVTRAKSESLGALDGNIKPDLRSNQIISTLSS